MVIRGIVLRVTQACASPSTHRDSRARQTSALRRPHPAGGGRRDTRIDILNIFHQQTFFLKEKVALTMRHREYILFLSVICDKLYLLVNFLYLSNV